MRPGTALAVSLVLTPLLWGLGQRTAFRTHVLIHAERERVTFEVEGASVSRPLALGAVRSIRVEAHDSIFGVGGGALRVGRGDRVLLDERLPRRFRFPADAKPAVGDWFVDGRSAAQAEVWSRAAALEPPFTLRAEFRGRAQRETAIVLEGARPARFEFARGMLRDRMSIATRAGGPRTELRVPVPGRAHALGMLDGPVRGALAACLLIAGFAGVGLAARRLRPTPAPRAPAPRDDRARVAAWAGMAALLPAALALWIWVALDVLAAVPHFQDGLCYLLRARWLLAGELYQSAPDIAEHLAIPFTRVEGGKWFTQFPVTWSALLALGELVGQPYLVAPASGGLGLLAVFLLGRELHGAPVGLAAALLAALSPMSALMFGSLMSHAAVFALLCGGFYLALRGARERSAARLALAGLALGGAFGMRPLAALATALPLGLHLLLPRPLPARLLAAAAAGGLLGSLPFFLDNWAVTGSPFRLAYTLVSGHRWSLGANLPAGLANGDPAFNLVQPLAFGWPWGLGPWALPLGWGLVLVPFLAGRAHRGDALLLAAFAMLPLAYLGHDASGINGYGPRFYFDGFFCLFVLAARGFGVLGELGCRADAPTAAEGAPAEPVRAARLRHWAGSLTGPLALLLLLGLSAATARVLPERLARYRGYNWVDDDLDRAVERAELREGVIVLDGSIFDWIRAANQIPADLDAPLVVVNRHGDDRALRARYPGRRFYRWQRDRLVPYAPAAPDGAD